MSPLEPFYSELYPGHIKHVVCRCTVRRHAGEHTGLDNTSPHSLKTLTHFRNCLCNDLPRIYCCFQAAGDLRAAQLLFSCCHQDFCLLSPLCCNSSNRVQPVQRYDLQLTVTHYKQADNECTYHKTRPNGAQDAVCDDRLNMSTSLASREEEE